MAGAKMGARDRKPERKRYGIKVRLLNLSGIDKFCNFSGRKLGERAMVVFYEGAYYYGWRESERAALASN